ncbi:hypothetical protein IHEIED_02657 [Methylorubrum populi]
MEQTLNPNFIKTREEARALVDADLITFQDYMLLCGFKGWNSDGPAPVQAVASMLSAEGEASQAKQSASNQELGVIPDGDVIGNGSRETEPAIGNAHPRFEIVSFSARRRAVPAPVAPDLPRHEKGRVLAFSRPLRQQHCR